MGGNLSGIEKEFTKNMPLADRMKLAVSNSQKYNLEKEAIAFLQGVDQACALIEKKGDGLSKDQLELVKYEALEYVHSAFAYGARIYEGGAGELLFPVLDKRMDEARETFHQRFNGDVAAVHYHLNPEDIDDNPIKFLAQVVVNHHIPIPAVIQKQYSEDIKEITVDEQRIKPI